jgi:hypothetical protein
MWPWFVVPLVTLGVFFALRSCRAEADEIREIGVGSRFPDASGNIDPTPISPTRAP